MAVPTSSEAMSSVRPLGRYGLTAAPVSFGGAPIGNLAQPVTPDQARLAVEAAWDTGQRYFDVAPHYGLGLAEQRLGEALAGKPREDYVVSTKVGRPLVETDQERLDTEGFAVTSSLVRQRDYSREGILRSLEASLKRLNMEHVDVVFVHDPDDHLEVALEEAFPTLEELRRQGVICSYGAGMNQADMLATFIQHTDVDVVMCAGRYTLLDRSAAALLDLAEARGVSVIAAGVFNSGLLALDVPSPTTTFDYRPVSDELLDRARRLAELCRSFGVSLPAAAAQFPLTRAAVASVCLGARSAGQVHRNVQLFDQPVPHELWRAIDHHLAAAGRPDE